MNESPLNLLREMSKKHNMERVRLHMHPTTLQKIRQKLEERYIKAFDELAMPNKFINKGEVFKCKDQNAFQALQLKPEFVRPPSQSTESYLYEKILQDQMALAVGLSNHVVIRDVAVGDSRPYKKYKNTMNLKAFYKYLKRKRK